MTASPGHDSLPVGRVLGAPEELLTLRAGTEAVDEVVQQEVLHPALVQQEVGLGDLLQGPLQEGLPDLDKGPLIRRGCRHTFQMSRISRMRFV